MEKHEIFNQAIGREKFEGCNKEDLLSIGITIGSDNVAFKELYTAYFADEARFEYKPRRGAKIEVEFNRLDDEVLIKRLETELKFCVSQFLDYLNLLTLCFSNIYPLGSIVELDEKLFTKEFFNASGVKEGESSLLAVITARFVPVDENNEQQFVEYVATQYPSGAIGVMYLNQALIKGVVHNGYSDEKEKAYVQELREELVMSNKKSIAFLTKDEVDVLIKYREARRRKKMTDGEVS